PMPIRNSRRSPIVRLASFVWGGLSWVRTAVLNLLTLFILVAILVAVFGPASVVLPDKAPLLVSPSGILVDQLSYTSPSARMLNFGNEGPMETLVRDLVDTIDHA